MIPRLKPLLVFMILLLSLLPVSISRVNASNEETASLEIGQAEEAVASAYEAVLEAQQAGANVSRLLGQLDVAAEYLAEAHMLYGLGNFDGAVHSANLSSEIGEDVKNEAEELKINAHESWVTSLLIRITGSLVGVIVVIFGTFAAWRVFKRRYLRQVKR